MSFSIGSVLCSKCKDAEAVMSCFGCGEKLCHKDYLEHRQNLSKDVEKFIDENNSFRNRLKEMEITSTIIKRIDEWEEKSHKIIQNAASQARDDAHQWVKMTRNDVEAKLAAIKTEVETKISKENFSEFDIAIWKNKLDQWRTLVQGPFLIEAQNDDQYKPLHMIKVVDQNTMNKLKSPQKLAEISTEIKYSPVSGSDTIKTSGRRNNFIGIATQHQNICAMAHYEKFSMEELRFHYYSQISQKSAVQLVSLLSTMSLNSDNGSTLSTNNPPMCFIPSPTPLVPSSSSPSSLDTNPFSLTDDGSSPRRSVVKAKRRAEHN